MSRTRLLHPSCAPALAVGAVLVANIILPVLANDDVHWGIIDKRGQFVVSPVWTSRRQAVAALSRIRPEARAEFRNDTFMEDQESPGKEGELHVSPTKSPPWQSRLIAKDGTELAVLPISYIHLLNSRRAVLEDGDEAKVLDDTGSIRHAEKAGASFVGNLGEKRFLLERKKTYSLLDDDGQLIKVLGTFENAKVLTDDRFCAKREDHSVVFFDSDGRVLNELQDVDEVLSSSYGPPASCSVRFNTGIEGYTDLNGKVIIAPRFTSAGEFFNGEPAKVQWQGQDGPHRGFINSTGKVIIDSTTYDEVGNFSEGRAAYRIGDRWGIMDKSGRAIAQLPKDCSYVGYFVDGLAPILLGKFSVDITKHEWLDFDNHASTRVVFINRAGDVALIPKVPISDVVTYSEGLRIESFSDGLLPITVGDRVFHLDGYLDRFGKMRISPRFAAAGPFHHGYALAAISPAEFDHKKWTDNPAARFGQALRFLTQFNVIGMSKDELFSKLGQQAFEGTVARYIVSSGWCGNTTCWLEFQISDDVVTAFRFGGVYDSDHWRTTNLRTPDEQWVTRTSEKMWKQASAAEQARPE